MDGSGSPFWFWEEDYVKLLQTRGVLGGRGSSMHAEAQAGGTGAARNGLPMEGSEVGKEIVILLKILCSVSACMLFVMVLNLLLVLMK